MVRFILRAITAPKLSYSNVGIALIGTLMVADQAYLAAITTVLVGGIVSGIVAHTVREAA